MLQILISWTKRTAILRNRKKGEGFACKEEIFLNEYRDEVCVKELLNDENLFNQYQESRTKESA